MTSAISGHWPATAAASTAATALLIWLAIYTTINAPINKQLTQAAQEGRVPPNARDLQTRWDSVIYLRAALQGIAVAGLCVTLVLHLDDMHRLAGRAAGLVRGRCCLWWGPPQLSRVTNAQHPPRVKFFVNSPRQGG